MTKRTKKAVIGIDIMNRNAITSLAMLYALWKTKKQDLLGLIRPFILYAVGTTTAQGKMIDINNVCKCMEKDFGYQSFQPVVVTRVLSREISLPQGETTAAIKKKDKAYFLVASLSTFIDQFEEKRTGCKSHADAVTNALAVFLNQNHVKNRTNYTQVEAEKILLSFFEKQGSAIVKSPEDLRQVVSRNNEIEYFVAKFILNENDKKSVLMDYTVELVKGYFITTALYLQAENPNITTSSFKDVTFFLDTRLLLSFLGYKTKEENISVQEMIHSLKRNGAKLACFDYNIEEVRSILEAYKRSTTGKTKNSTLITLEYFDENGRSYTHVDSAQRLFEQRLIQGEIQTVSPNKKLEEEGISLQALGILDDEKIKEILLKAKPSYNTLTLSDDLIAINTVSRIRQGKRLPYIERCKAVFVTSNTLLVSAVKSYHKENSFDPGFPVAITDEELCVIAWLKDFEQSNKLPQMRLLENVLAAITPSKDLMDEYFNLVDHLEQQGDLSGDEAAFMRVDMFCRNELMDLTKGNKENVNSQTILDIRNKLQKDNIESGYKQGEADATKRFEQRIKDKKNKACQQAERDVNKEYTPKEEKIKMAVKFIVLAICVSFIGATIYLFVSQKLNYIMRIMTFIVTVVTTVQGVCTLTKEDNWLIVFALRRLEQKKLKEIDMRKEKYMRLIDSESEEEIDK